MIGLGRIMIELGRGMLIFEFMKKNQLFMFGLGRTMTGFERLKSNAISTMVVYRDC